MNRREAFLPDVLRSRVIGDPCRSLLVVLATRTDLDPKCRRGCYPMKDDGMVRICREELAEALGGIAPKAVSNRIAEAVRAGLLTKETGGRNGQVAGYQAHPPSMATGHRRNGPESLAALLTATISAREEAVVGTTPVVPETGSEALVGTTGIAPYARAHYLQNSASKNPTTAESRADREDDVTGKGGTNRDEWIPTPSRRLFGIEVVDDGSAERFPDERPAGEVA